MKLVGLVLLGLVVSAALYFPVFLLIGLILETMGFKFSESLGMLLAFFAVIPIAFLLGSIIPGYFSYYDIENKWSLTLMAPALYVNLLGICVFGVQFGLEVFMGDAPSRYGFLGGLLIPLGIGLLWYLPSLAGVFLGYYLRQRFAKWRFGD
jgi:hypothetical protein